MRLQAAVPTFEVLLAHASFAGTCIPVQRLLHNNEIWQHIALLQQGTCHDAEGALQALAGCLQTPEGSGRRGKEWRGGAATARLHAQSRPILAQVHRPPALHFGATAALL